MIGIKNNASKTIPRQHSSTNRTASDDRTSKRATSKSRIIPGKLPSKKQPIRKKEVRRIRLMMYRLWNDGDLSNKLGIN